MESKENRKGKICHQWVQKKKKRKKKRKRKKCEGGKQPTMQGRCTRGENVYGEEWKSG
jgi:hypothetical protein